MKKIFSVVSARDFAIICMIKVCVFILRKLRYYDYYESLLGLIRLYSQRGYTLIQKQKYLQVSGKENFPGCKFLLRPNSSDSYVFEQVIEHQEYLPLYEHIKIANMDREINTIIDAGANIGLTSLFFNNYFPKANIFSIEADQMNNDLLERNISANRLSEKVVSVHKALWNTDNAILMIRNDFRDHESWSRRVEKATGEDAVNDVNSVSSITLKTLMEEQHIDMVDILKIDIEGAEKELFADNNFLATLSEKVKYIALEIHNEFCSRGQIDEALSSIHFKLFEEGETSFYLNSNLAH